MTQAGLAMPQAICEVAERLQEEYGDFAHHNQKDPFDELLFVICSVMTQHAKYLVTYEKLRKRYPEASAFADAPIKELQGVLEWGGLAKKKALMIKEIAIRLKSDFGSVTLAPLAVMNVEEQEDYLTSQPGVGKKIARCVLMYSFGRPVFPVDRHCWRIAKRLGWVSGGDWCSDSQMDHLQDIIPPFVRFSLHVNMVSHGRAVCTSRLPSCSSCRIRDLCPTGASL